MLDHMLSCNIIGIPNQPFSMYTEAARAWLGDIEPENSGNGFLTWLEPESVELGASESLKQADDLQLYSRRGFP